MIGIVLAGGKASRFGGGDKGRHLVGGRSILDRVVAVMSNQCDGLIINANGDPSRFAALTAPIVADATPDQPGPLAGVLAGLDHVALYHPDADFAVTVPTDTPFLPSDLVGRLQDTQAADQAMIICARSGGRVHYVAALWAVALRHDLRRALRNDERRVLAFVERQPFRYGRMACDTLRSVLQRQRAGRPRGGGTDRGNDRLIINDIALSPWGDRRGRA